MKRLTSIFLATALAGICILTAIGCSSNPVTSEVVIASDSPQQDSVVYDNADEGYSGGYPATPTTTIEKYESEQEAVYLNRTP